MLSPISLVTYKFCNSFPKQPVYILFSRNLRSNVFRSCSGYSQALSDRYRGGPQLKRCCNLFGVLKEDCSVLYKKQIHFTYQYTQINSFSDKKETASKTTESTVDDPLQDGQEKVSLMRRFKMMYRDYWYILVPVHLVTSVGWFGSFYYLAKSGVDVVALLESVGVSQKLIEPLRDSSAGYLALAYALYKISTPVRYTVTIGGTTLSIKYLKEYGYIKPIPPKEKLKEMYQEKKDNLMERRDNFTEGLRHRKEQFKERGESIMEEYRKKRIKK